MKENPRSHATSIGCHNDCETWSIPDTRRNCLKGIVGDAVNPMLGEAAYHFKKLMNQLFEYLFWATTSVISMMVISSPASIVV